MSVEELRKEAERWLEIAKSDYESAEILFKSNKYAHACFFCQQAAEKALKAVWYCLGQETLGRSVLKLIEELQLVSFNIYREFKGLKGDAQYLDEFYISARYPDALSDATPDEIYDKEDAEKALYSAKKILDKVKELME